MSPIRQSVPCSALLLLTVSMSSWIVATTSRAGYCPGPNPQLAESVTSQYLSQCQTLGPGNTCPKPSAPSISSGTAYPQEVTVTATVPSTDATVVKFRADYGLAMDNLWTHKLIRSPGTTFTADSTVTFGAPGLVENATNYIRVAYCFADTTCTCWSDPTSVTLSSFSSVGPAPPAAIGSGHTMVQEVEDNFNRPDTGPTCREANDTTTALGDGLGPTPQTGPASTGVWSSCNPSLSNQNVRVKDHAAFATPSSTMTYTRQAALGEHSYSEGLLRVYDPATGEIPFNLQASTRQYVSGMQVYSWNAKIMNQIRECSTPAIGLFRFPDQYSIAGCYSNTPTSYYMTMPTADTSDKCDAAPPLATVDSSPPSPLPSNVSQPVWLRVEARNEEISNGVFRIRLVGSVAWGNCSSGQDISQCDHVCTISRLADSFPSGALSEVGMFGMSFHDRYYYVDLFRAGSDPQSQ